LKGAEVRYPDQLSQIFDRLCNYVEFGRDFRQRSVDSDSGDRPGQIGRDTHQVDVFDELPVGVAQERFDDTIRALAKKMNALFTDQHSVKTSLAGHLLRR
jgi:hypothetical protein